MLFRFCVLRVNFELYLCVVVKIKETVILRFEAFEAFEPFFVELFDSEHGALRAMGKLFQVSEDPEEGKTDFVDLEFVGVALVFVVGAHFGFEFDDFLDEADFL